ncbi:MAG: YbaN family protein [Clostridiales bacterium]|jgi:uncharacterized membrane protein YbaN (DUF454 family)|nr:YbaN family protein [Clostridiales bacterium]
MKRVIYNILGAFFVVVAIIGAFLPILPTTPFLILASMLFTAGSPKMRAWLLRSKFLGPYLDNYYNKRGLTTAYKLRLIANLWAGMAFAITIVPLLFVQILLVFIGICVTIHLARSKKMGIIPAQLGAKYSLLTLVAIWFWLGIGLFLASYPFEYALLTGVGGALSLITLSYAIITKKRLSS